MDTTHYSIGRFSELSGIPIRTLHYYEEVGLLHPKRRDNGHRYYDTADLITLQKIIGLKSLGFSLERIRKFVQQNETETSLAEALHIQQQALHTARAELDKSLMIVERLQAILKEKGSLEHDMMFLLIRNMQREDKQRSWTAENLSEKTATALFGLSQADVAELDREMIAFCDAVKRLSKGRVDTLEAEEMIGFYIQRVFQLLDEKTVADLENISEEQHERLSQLVDMPFNQQESDWLDEALAHYANKFGLPEIEKSDINHEEKG